MTMLLCIVLAGSLAACSSSLTNDATFGARSGGDTAKDFQSPSTSPSSQTSTASSAFAAATTSGNDAYKVGPLDVLDISVFKVPELSKSVKVSETGRINLPLLGEIQAAGMTAQEIERDLTKKLGAKYLKSPQVTVFVKDHNSQQVTIEGAVIKAGVYPIRGQLSLVQLIATAGGVNNDLYAKDVTIFRTSNGERTSKVFDIDAIRTGQAPDPQLQQGDVVVVDTSSAKVALQNTLKIVPAAALLKPPGL